VWRVDDAKFLVDVMPRALNLAQTGRPGAVLIDVPMDVFAGTVEGEPTTILRRPRYWRVAGPVQGIDEALALLSSAKRPVVFAGNGIALSEASPELKTLAELLSIPVATTLMGKGVFPENHPLALGTTGIWGTRAANSTTLDADVILAIGTAFGESDCSSWSRTNTFAVPPSQIIQIDIDPEEIGKIYPVTVGIVGDAKTTLQEMIDRGKSAIRPEPIKNTYLKVIEERKQAWRTELKATQEDAGKPIHPARLLAELSRAAPDDVIFVTDVGWNKNGAGQQLESKTPRSFITSGGFATMGFSPAAAIGAQMGAPERRVIGLVGDGGLMSVIGALATAVELNIPVLWVLFNNFCYSTILSVGSTYFGNTTGTVFTRPDGTQYNPDFMLMAKAFGIDSALVEDPDDIAGALKTAISANVPYLLEVRTRGDVPMPRTGYWDIADFLRLGNE
jgi:acetolactate synthase I/II/III large subunit